jgi:hypothetical protein
LPANLPHPWKPEWIALLQAFQAQIPSDWTVIVMTDRGLYAHWLYQEIVALCWHTLMRITHLSTFCPEGSQSSVPVTNFAPQVGCRGQVRGEAFPRRPQRRLCCTLLACWEAGHDQAWFVLTDLAPEQAEALWYGMRAWIEPGFKVLKSGGWQWQSTRITDPERAGRIWLVLAVATLAMLAVGGEADAADVPVGTDPELPPAGPKRSAAAKDAATTDRRKPPRSAAPAADKPQSPKPGTRTTGTKNRLVSVFRRGIAVFLALLITGHSLPKPQWNPEPWLELRAKCNTAAEQPPTPIP